MLAERISIPLSLPVKPDTRSYYADVLWKTAPYDGNRTDYYAIRVFYKYLADEFDVAHCAHIFKFLYNLGTALLPPRSMLIPLIGFRQEDQRFSRMFSNLEQRQCIRVTEFVEFVNRQENQGLFDRIFYKESGMPTHQFNGCNIL